MSEHTNIILTKHAIDRQKERNGINKKACGRLAEIALENGITHSETHGSLRRWIDSLYFSKKRANNIRIYGNKAYLFRYNTLITVINVPNKYISTVKSINDKKKKVGGNNG